MNTYRGDVNGRVDYLEASAIAGFKDPLVFKSINPLAIMDRLEAIEARLNQLETKPSITTIPGYMEKTNFPSLCFTELKLV